MNRKSIYLSFITLLMFGSMFAQTTIKGLVSDQSNMPLPGVSVIIKGTSTGAITNFDGTYSITVPDNQSVLSFQFIGFKTVEKTVGSQTVIDIVLEEMAESLEQVIVTAQGIKKSRKALGYSVSELDSKDIEQRPEANLANALLGKVSGLNITSSNGQTGSGVSLTIRGVNSISQGNGPLYIVDNVPFKGSITDIDANNIKSMSVLKGLNASILYGSAGKNGVILIQTKSGSAELGKVQTTASVSSTTYINLVSQLPEFQNSWGQGQENLFGAGLYSIDGPNFDELDEVVHPYAGYSDIFPEFAGATVPYEAKPNNVKNLFNTGIGKIHSLSVATSKDNLAFNLNAGYTDEQGIIGHNDLKRFNLSVGGKAKLSDKFSIASTLNYSTRKVNQIQSGEIFGRIMYLARNIDITEYPYQNPLTGESVYYINSETNPLWTLNNTGNFDDIVRVFGTFTADYNFTDDLKLTYRAGFDSEQSNSFDYSNKGGENDDAYLLGYLNINDWKEVTVDQTLILGYTKQLTNKLNLDAQVGVNSNLRNNRTHTTNLDNQIVYDFLRPSNFSVSESSYSENKRNYAGAFGQIQLDYNNYLYTTISGRNDWGSTVEKENNSLFYPGASVSFIPTSAFDFIKGNTINYLKLRAAYATSSGFPDSAYRTRNTFVIDPLRFAAADGSYPITNRFSSIYANPDLRPELHKEVEFGIEARLFNNRVTLEASVYSRISEDQIIEANMPYSTSYDIQYINLGRVDNEGLEIDLGIDIIKSDKFNWNMKNLFSMNESLVVKTTAAGSEISITHDRYAIEGLPFGAIKGDYALRDDEGNLLINGNGGDTRQGEVLNSGLLGLDSKVIGDPNPDFRLTNINTFEYKNFTFSAQIDYTHGGEIYASVVKDMLERNVTKDSESSAYTFIVPGYLADSTTGELFLDVDGNKIPNDIQLSSHRTMFSNYYINNDLSMWDTTLFRLRELSLGYSLTPQKSKTMPFSKIDISLIGRNLWYKAPNFPEYVNYDPENDGGMGYSNVPSTKRFALSVTFTF